MSRVDSLLREAPVHPGKILEGVLLRNYNMTVDDLARRSKINKQTLVSLIAGERPVTKEISAKLKPVFRTAADNLLGIQVVFDHYTATGERPDNEKLNELLNNLDLH